MKQPLLYVRKVNHFRFPYLDLKILLHQSKARHICLLPYQNSALSTAGYCWVRFDKIQNNI